MILIRVHAAVKLAGMFARALALAQCLRMAWDVSRSATARTTHSALQSMDPVFVLPVIKEKSVNLIVLLESLERIVPRHVTAMVLCATMKMASASAIQGGRAFNVSGPAMALHMAPIAMNRASVKIMECVIQLMGLVLVRRDSRAIVVKPNARKGAMV